MQQLTAIRSAESKLVADCHRAADVLDAVTSSEAVASALERLQASALAASDRLRSASRVARAILTACEQDVSLVALLDEPAPLMLETAPTFVPGHAEAEGLAARLFGVSREGDGPDAVSRVEDASGRDGHAGEANGFREPPMRPGPRKAKPGGNGKKNKKR